MNNGVVSGKLNEIHLPDEQMWVRQSMAWAVVILCALLGMWGCLAIYSTQIAALQDWGFLGRQVVYLLIGLPVLLAAWSVPFEKYEKYGWVLGGLALIGVIGVLFFGRRINGMAGWFEPLPGVGVQPSELAKPFYLLMLYLVWKNMRRYGDGYALFALCCTALAFVIPVAEEPDLGSAAIFLGSLVIFVFLSGCAIWKLLLSAGICALLATPAVLMRWNLVVQRFMAVFNTAADPNGGGWHVQQFQLAIARGGWTGSKLGNTVWTENYLPLAHNDSIFAAMAETLGFFGTLPLLIMLAALVVILIKLALLNSDASRAGFVASAAFMIALQALFHISVNATLLPPSGLTLPLISSGGSSLISTMLLVGMALSASKCKS